MSLDYHRVTLITVTKPRPKDDGWVDEVIHCYSHDEARQKIREFKQRDSSKPYKRRYYLVSETLVEKLD